MANGKKIIKHKKNNYTSIDNEILKSTELSLKAIGLLCKLLSLPDDWEYSAKGLEQICLEGKSSIQSALKELKEHKYLYIRKVGIEYEWHIFEKPYSYMDIRDTDYRDTENQPRDTDYRDTENRVLENQTQLNTNNKILNNKKKKIYKKRNFKKPTLEEVKEYCRERNNLIDPERFIDYYESVGWKIGNKPMKDWKASVRTWEKNQRIYDSSPPKEKRLKHEDDYLESNQLSEEEIERLMGD